MFPRDESDLCYNSVAGNTVALKLKKTNKKPNKTKTKNKTKNRDGIDIFLVNPSNLGHDY